jgi:hypothetical protein
MPWTAVLSCFLPQLGEERALENVVLELELAPWGPLLADDFQKRDFQQGQLAESCE